MKLESKMSSRFGSLQLSMMRAHFLLILALLASLVHCFDLGDSEYDEYSLISLVVVGDYAYVNGGVLTQYISSRSFEDFPNRATASLPLTESWTSDRVQFKIIAKGDSPLMHKPLLWPDPESSSFYLWGCWGWTLIDTPDFDDIWVFRADDFGGGKWSLKDSANPAVFNALHYAQGRTPTTCNGVGYALGGRRLKDDNETWIAVPGLVTYEMETSMWANESTQDFLYSPRGGEASCLPHLGDKGLLIFYGMIRTEEPGTERHYADTEFSTFGNIALYDPANERWFWQKTTGDAPPPLIIFCSVGVQGPNGTYEIFVFGGVGRKPGDTEDSELDDVWILTLPGFNWFQVDTRTAPRAGHACGLVGKRQMLSVGGLTGYGPERPREPWHKSIGILDLTELTWSDRYDADAPEYDSPDIVKAWYDNGGQVEWDNSELARLFETSTEQPGPGNDTDGERDGSGSSTPVGAIAGGTVGGVAFLAIIIAGLFLWRRRNRKKSQEANAEAQTRDWRMSELSADGKPPPSHEMDAGIIMQANNTYESQGVESPVSPVWSTPPPVGNTEAPGYQYR